jgi:hypothetical protein
MKTFQRTKLVITTLGLVTAALAPSAVSAVEPPVNTGGTSFMDGFGDPRGSGLSYMQYARFSTAGSIKDGSGNDVGAFVNPRLNVFASLNQFLYTFKTDDWSVHPGVYAIIPLVALNSSFGAGGASLQDNGFGMGDVLMGSYLQFNTIATADHRPVFAHRADIAVQAPTGKYDPMKQINPGTNTWAINPSWAATLMPLPRFEVSTRFNYLYNFQNGNPGGGLMSTQAGQAIFDNFAVAYEILPFDPSRTAAHSLRAGLNGYFFKQITESAVNGAKQSGSQEQVLGVGPGAMWIPTNSDAFYLNVYFETAVENRFAANVFQARWARMF